MSSNISTYVCVFYSHVPWHSVLFSKYNIDVPYIVLQDLHKAAMSCNTRVVLLNLSRNFQSNFLCRHTYILSEFHKFRSISTSSHFLPWWTSISCHCCNRCMHHNHRYKGISALSLSSYTYWWWWWRRSNVPPHQTYTWCVQKLQMMKQLLLRRCN